MRFLRITHSINPVNGGVAAAVNEFAMASLGIEDLTVEVLCLDAPELPFINAAPYNIHAIGPGMMNYGFSRQLKPWLKQHARQYDVIIIDGIWQYHSIASHSCLTAMGIPYYLFTHGMLAPWFRKTYPLKHLKKSIYWRFPGEYKVIRDAKAVLFTSEEEMKQAQESFLPWKSNNLICSLGIKPPDIDTQAAENALLQKFPELKNRRLLLCLCRLHEIKGCDILIQAFHQLSQANPDFHLVIAGPGSEPYLSSLKALVSRLGIESKVTFTGMLHGVDKWACLRLADAFVLASHHESFGMAVVEALSQSKPVLISNKIPIWQEIETAAAGLVGEDSVSGFSSILRQYDESTHEAQAAMQQNAKACFEEHFEASQTAIQLMSLIR